MAGDAAQNEPRGLQQVQTGGQVGDVPKQQPSGNALLARISGIPEATCFGPVRDPKRLHTTRPPPVSRNKHPGGDGRRGRCSLVDTRHDVIGRSRSIRVKVVIGKGGPNARSWLLTANTPSASDFGPRLAGASLCSSDQGVVQIAFLPARPFFDGAGPKGALFGNRFWQSLDQPGQGSALRSRKIVTDVFASAIRIALVNPANRRHPGSEPKASPSLKALGPARRGLRR